MTVATVLAIVSSGVVVPVGEAKLVPLSRIVMVSANGSFGMALMSDGRVVAWGDNGSGQLGNGTTDPSLTPTEVSGLGSGSGVVAISAGGTGYALALKSDGTVLAWGANVIGQLGDGTTTGRTTPGQVSGLGPGSGVVAIAAGFTHALALKGDGTVLGWGRNQLGATGDGTTVSPRVTPVETLGLGPGSGVTAITAGSNFSLARRSDGALFAWGNNGTGTVGDGTTVQRNSPVRVQSVALSSARLAGAVDATATTLTVDSTDGYPATGRLMVGSEQMTYSGTTATSFTGVARGEFNTSAATHADGDAVQLLVDMSGVSRVSAGPITGSLYAVALKADGSVFAWGQNTVGQLGDGTTTRRIVPTPVSGLGPGSGVIEISAGGSAGRQHALALKSDGTVLSWGSNGGGQLGNGTTDPGPTPAPVTGLGGGSGVIGIATGDVHCLALRADGTVLAWGDNSAGQLGNGTISAHTTAVQTSGLGDGSGVVSISARNSHALALKADGSVLAWGGNARGELGDGTTESRNTPVSVAGLGAGSGVTAISAGNGFSLALTMAGTALSWGANTNGQLGDGTTTGRPTPGEVTGATDLVAISAGVSHALALKSDGTVLAWGSNGSGRLGDGTTVQRPTPVLVQSVVARSAVTTDSPLGAEATTIEVDSTAGYPDSGRLLIDGEQVSYQGTTPTRFNGVLRGQFGTTSATHVAGSVVIGLANLTGATAVVTSALLGSGASFVLRSDGAVFGIGLNAISQLGDGTRVSRNLPVEVSGLGAGSGVVAIEAYHRGGFALKSDGSVVGWGANVSGALGDGTTAERTTPVPALGGASGVTQLAGSGHLLALTSGGTLLAAGANTSGQLGDGTLLQRLDPVVVLGLGAESRVVQIAAGATFSLALTESGKVLGWGANESGQLGDGTVYDGGLTPSDVLMVVPSVTAESISVSGASGTEGAFKVGDTVVVRWDASSAGDDAADLAIAPTADLSAFGGPSSAPMSDSDACGGTAGDGVFEACHPVSAADPAVERAGVAAAVSATNANGSTTTSDDASFTVDNRPPTIDISVPIDGGIYVLNQAVNALWSVSDASGVADATATAASGNPLDTSTPGAHTFSVSAVDAAGNSHTVTVTYLVTFETLIKTTPEQAGQRCPNGGNRLELGLDANGNGTLEPSEVSSTSFVCFPAQRTGCQAAPGAGWTGVVFILLALFWIARRRPGERRSSVS